MTPPEAETDTTDPFAGLKALLAERDACEARTKEINVELQKARGLIDGRTLGAPRKPRKEKVVHLDAKGQVVEPEPSAAA